MLQIDEPRLPCSDNGLTNFGAVRNILLLQVSPKQEKEIVELMTLYNVD